MHIGTVEFSTFRNYRSFSFTPTPTLNILTGLNAQGKTNLLEGLGLLVVGRSFRGARAAELPTWGCPAATIAGELHRAGSVRGLRRVVSQRDDGSAWTVSGDGCDWARAIPFGWQDLALFTGGPQVRRNFIDGFTGKMHPAHLAALGRYRQVLGRRNHLLQRGVDRGALRTLLQPWDEQLVELGLELGRRRRDAVRTLEREAARLYPELAGQGEVRLVYRSSLDDGISADAFRALLGARVGEELRRGQTLVGPHRDDLAIELDGSDLRVYGSRGQQRLMTLALRLAEVGPVAEAVGSTPVLLLDDALSELDPVVQARALQHVGRAGQVFLSTAEPSLPDVCAADWWEVKGGWVTEMSASVAGGAA